MSEHMRAILSAWLGTEESLLRYEMALNRVGQTDLMSLQTMAHSAPASLLAGGGENCCVSNIPYMAHVENGIGVIEVNGVLTAEYVPWNRFMGLVSYDEIAYAARAMQVMASAGELSAVILKVNSPGGDANGIEIASSALKLLGKQAPIYTYTDKEMCSAGYWLGCIGDEIWSSKLATVGSIGVLVTIRTVVDALKMAGIKIRLLREGQYKAAVNPYEDPTPEMLERVQSQMAIMYGMFTTHVAAELGTTAAALKAGPGQGQTFLGVEAIKEGLVHKLGSMEDMVKALRTKYSPGNSGGSPSKVKAINGSTPMKIFKIKGKTYQLNEAGINAMQAGGITEDEAAQNMANLQEVVEETEEEKVAREQKEADDQKAADEKAEADRLADEELAAGGKPGAKDTPAATASADVSAILQLSAANSQISGELAVVKRQLEEAQAKLTLAETNNASLRGIAVKAINKMEVGLRSAPSKSTDFDSDSAVVAKFARIENDYNAQFKPGAKAAHSTDGHQPNAGATAAASPAVQKAAQGLTQL